MATYSTNEFKSGLKVLVDNEPCSILENEVVKPGKGQAFNRVKFRNLLNSRVWERTYKSGESIEAADVMETDMEYLYSDGEFWHFMKTDDSYEQVAADSNAVREAINWLKEQDTYQVILWNDSPISVIILITSVAWIKPIIPGRTPNTPASEQDGSKSLGGGSGTKSLKFGLFLLRLKTEACPSNFDIEP